MTDGLARDQDGRARAVDPRFNVALEASAGTGKTRVLVTRYINLLRAGVAPRNILAMTFTRKAAAEMRERIVSSLRTAADRGELTAARWREIRERMGDITISTIDAFCLSLLREFPLEADLDPGFSLADDTEVPRLIDESLDRALRICRAVAQDDEHVALVFAQIGDRRARAGLASLLNRRLVAPAALARYLSRAPKDLTIAAAAARAEASLRDLFRSMPGGMETFLRTGPPQPGFTLLGQALTRLGPHGQPLAMDPAVLQALFARLRDYFLTHDGAPRTGRMRFRKEQFRTAADYRKHRDLVFAHAPGIREIHLALRRDLNVLVSRGVQRMFRIAESEYRRTLDSHAVLDFPDVLLKALDLLRQMEEFSQSRYRLESRYHHVLVDEFQDTSRAQWELIALLVQAWGEGAGLAHAGPLPPSIFIVGDRKQSIYGFRDAQASILREAAAHLQGLRPDGDVRRSISRSFRSVPELLTFVNDVCQQIEKVEGRPDAFQYDEDDRFPDEPPQGAAGPSEAPSDAVSFLAAATPSACASAIAGEIARLLDAGDVVRDRDTGVRRAARPGDIAILFRTRESHREIEDALERRGVPSYVYKGLGFFDADEIKDVLAALWYLADPTSDLRAAAFLRSRFVRLSDEGLRLLAGGIADALRRDDPRRAGLCGPPGTLDAADALALDTARVAVERWLGLVDRLPPAELLDVVLAESAYAVELRGPRAMQARENLKKIRGLIRRMQNRGYATTARVAAYLDRLAVGDEANAAIDALDAVNLMTVHASKGLEFPIVFVVNLTRGTGSRRPPMRISAGVSDDDVTVAVGDFESQADEDAAAREREETKRLLYVALTRARDRLYLSAPLEDGKVVPGKGSLAEVLPAFVIARLEEAGSVKSEVGSRTLEAVKSEVVKLEVGSVSERAAEAPVSPAADVSPLVDTAALRVSVAHAAATREWMAAGGSLTDRGGLAGGGGDSTRLVGVLVHRLLERGLEFGVADDELRRRIAGVIRPAEAAAHAALETLAADVAQAFRSLSANAELRRLYASGVPLHEVPFTLRDGGRVIRGTIDCVIDGSAIAGNWRVTVVEFKTGRPRPEHRAQAELYTRAVRAAYPESDVETRLFYADPAQ